MAKYKPMDLIKSLHGKVCAHSDVYFAERYGTRYTAKRCNPRTTPPSEKETALRTKFSTVIQTVKNLSEEEKNAYKTAWTKNPKGYSTLRGYIFAQEYKKVN